MPLLHAERHEVPGVRAAPPRAAVQALLRLQGGRAGALPAGAAGQDQERQERRKDAGSR